MTGVIAQNPMSPKAKPKGFFRGIRGQLLLVSLTLLAIPWAGYLFIQETETFLRQGQEQTLLGTARSIGNLLQGRSALFPGEADRSAPLAGSVYARALERPIQLDGYREDWSAVLDQAQNYFPQPSGDSTDATRPSVEFDLLAGMRDEYLYLLLQVRDDKIVYRSPNSIRLDRSDHLEIVTDQADGSLARYQLATLSPGWVNAHRLGPEPGNPYPVDSEVRIKGEWQETPEGYTLEIRIPRSLLGKRFGVAVGDVDDAESRRLEGRVVTSNLRSSAELGMIVTPSSKIANLLHDLEYPDARVWVLDSAGQVLARQGHLQRSSELPETGESPPQGLMAAFLQWVLKAPRDDFRDDLARASQLKGEGISAALAGEPATWRRSTPDQRAVILSAAYPILSANQALGAVIVEQTTNSIASIQHQALQRLILVTLALFAATSLLLLGFASYLTRRIRRLRDRTEAAVAADGRILAAIEPGRQYDEIGDLERSFSSVLGRLAEYNRHLESAASRLAHEIRTPLTVVQSSLENLDQETDPAASSRYLGRAHEGVRRLSRLVAQLHEATRLEQALQHAEIEPCDLCALVRAAAENYRAVYPQTGFETELPTDPIQAEACADLIVQALDKLVSNAVDFHRPGTPIDLALTTQGDRAVLTVRNQGPPLPDTGDRRLFDSMVSLRKRSGDAEPHLGLGLYLVRLISAFHGGSVGAENLPSEQGVQFSLQLPRS